MDSIRLMTEGIHGEVENDPKRLATFRRVASEIVAMDHKMDGPMPPEVEAFVRRYHAPDA